MKSIRIVSLVGVLIATSVGAQDPKKYYIPEDPDSWTNQVAVLFSNDRRAEKARETLDAVFERVPANLPAQALREDPPSAAALFLPAIEPDTEGEESARAVLGRYVILEYPNETQMDRVVRELARDPEVELALLDEKLGPRFSSLCDSQFTDAVIAQVSGYPNDWGRTYMNIDAAWGHERGHSYIGILDMGADPEHEDLRVFGANNNYLQGNFHEHLSWDIGNHLIYYGSNGYDDGEPPNPYSARGIEGESDEHRYIERPNYSDTLSNPPQCDSNGPSPNQTIEVGYAGHGSHVTGILGANGTNSLGIKGACKHCPLMIMRPSYISQCEYDVNQHSGTEYEGLMSPGSYHSLFATMGFAVDIGAQLINFSGGYDDPRGFTTGSPCDNSSLHLECQVLEYAMDRDVMVFAAVGNFDRDAIDFPARHHSVYGVGAIDQDGSAWHEEAGCGTNEGQGSNLPSFSAPGVNIYSTMYAGVDYVPDGCHEHNDGVEAAYGQGDGYGYCTGTSMAAPFAAGTAALVRSVNPLAPREDVFEMIRQSTNLVDSGLAQDSKLGWGVPKADEAVKSMLGVVNGQQVQNRTSPLFVMHGSLAQDYTYSAKPQVMLAFHTNKTWGYTTPGDYDVVEGYSYRESDHHLSPQAPRSDFSVMTTHREVVGGHEIGPIYRMRKIWATPDNPDNVDTLLAVSKSEVESFKASGYNLEGVEGYIYTRCSPEPGCMPPGTLKIYRAYNPERDDYAIFSEWYDYYMRNKGFIDSKEVIGYAYRNKDSDGDTLTDGLERLIGTDWMSADSDCDGLSDDTEFPIDGKPASDPMSPMNC